MFSSPSQDIAAIDLLRLKKQLLASCSSAADWQVETTAKTTSTNTDLFLRAKKIQGWAKPIVYIADWQTAGRGRLERAWLAQPGQALLCSIGITMPKSTVQLAGLSLAVGSLLIEALQNLVQDSTRQKENMQFGLKWPNDILLNEKKLGGVLIETVQKDADFFSNQLPAKPFFNRETGKATHVVIGIGINLRDVKHLASPNQFAQDNLINPSQHNPCKTKPFYSPAYLTECIDDSINLRTDLLAKIMISLGMGLKLFNTHGFSYFIKTWWQWHAYSKRMVSISENDKEILRGRATGIDEMGRLIITNDEGVHAIVSGDLSLRSTESI